MDFLKDILGTELFEQVANAVNAYNGDEANKDKQIKIANLASGKYVDKGKYTALEELLNKKDSDLTDVIIRKQQHRQSHKVHHLYHQLHH